MDVIEKLTNLLVTHPREVLISILLFVVGYLYKDGRARENAHLQTTLTIAPLASKLAECVGILERVTSVLLARDPSAQRNGGQS